MYNHAPEIQLNWMLMTFTMNMTFELGKHFEPVLQKVGSIL